MKKNCFQLLFALILISSIPMVSQTINFDYETGYLNHLGEKVQEISGVSITFSSDVLGSQDLWDAGGIHGSSGYIVASFDYNAGNLLEESSFTFNQAVNVISIYIIDYFSESHTWTLTPDNLLDNSPVVANTDSNAYGKTVDLNWTDVTSFTITQVSSSPNFAFDNILIVDPNSTLSTENIELNKDLLKLAFRDNRLYVKYKGVEVSKFELYDLTGRKLNSSGFSTSTLNTSPIFIVKAYVDDSSFIVKKFMMKY